MSEIKTTNKGNEANEVNSIKVRNIGKKYSDCLK